MIDPAIAPLLESTGTPWGSSRWATHHECRRRYRLRYHDQLVPLGESPDYFRIGSLLHACRAYVQLGVMAGEPEPLDWNRVLAAATEQEQQAAEAANREADLGVIDEAERLMIAYDFVWGRRFARSDAYWPAGTKVHAVEMPVESTIGYTPITTQLDSVLEIEGRFYIVDIKSRAARWSSDPEQAQERARRAYRVRPQFVQSSWQLRQTLGLDYYPPVWVDLIVKTKVPAFDRVLVEFSERTVELWYDGQEAAVHEAEAEHDDCVMLPVDPYPPNLTQCAPDIGTPCAYYDYCHGSDETRELHYGRLRPTDNKEIEQ